MSESLYDKIYAVTDRFRGKSLTIQNRHKLTEAIVEALDVNTREELQAQKTTVEVVTSEKTGNTAIVAEPPKDPDPEPTAEELPDPVPEPAEPAEPAESKPKPEPEVEVKAIVSYPDPPYNPNQPPDKQDDTAPLRITKRK